MYRFGPPMQLSERVPILENLGFSAIDGAHLPRHAALQATARAR
jgi:NAD-specific glutamate dehydrogenase